MTRIATTIQKKNTMTPGMAYPATVRALAMVNRYPVAAELMREARSGLVRSGFEVGEAGFDLGQFGA